MHPSPSTHKGIAGFIKPPAAATRSTTSYSNSNMSIARGEMDVISTTVRDVTGHNLFTFGEIARAGSPWSAGYLRLWLRWEASFHR